MALLDISPCTLLYIIKHSLKHEKIVLAVHLHIDSIRAKNLSSLRKYEAGVGVIHSLKHEKTYLEIHLQIEAMGTT